MIVIPYAVSLCRAFLLAGTKMTMASVDMSSLHKITARLLSPSKGHPLDSLVVVVQQRRRIN